MQLTDINKKNVNAFLSAYYNIYAHQVHIQEQAEERVKRCMSNNAKCSTLKETFDPITNTTTTNIIYTNCDKCGCSAPAVFFANYKDCNNWGDLQHLKSMEEWIEYKYNKNALHNNNEDTSNGQSSIGGILSDNISREDARKEEDRGIEDIFFTPNLPSQE